MSDMQKDPTMDDILASIRQIISDEDNDGSADSGASAVAAAPKPQEPQFHAHDEDEGPDNSTAERLDIEAVLSQFATGGGMDTSSDFAESPANTAGPSQPAATIDDMEIVDFTASQEPAPRQLSPPPSQPMPWPTAPTEEITPAPVDNYTSAANILDAPSNSGGSFGGDDNYFIVMDDASDSLSPPENPTIFPTVSDEVSIEFPHSPPQDSHAAMDRDTKQIEDALANIVRDDAQAANMPFPTSATMPNQQVGNATTLTNNSPSQYVDFFQKEPTQPTPEQTASTPVEEYQAPEMDTPTPPQMETEREPMAALPPITAISSAPISRAETRQRVDETTAHGSHPEFSPLASKSVTNAAATTIGNLFAELEVSGDKTIEAIIRELLRPLLKEWLDNNLASIVDEKVESEIRRIARLAR